MAMCVCLNIVLCAFETQWGTLELAGCVKLFVEPENSV